MEKEWEKETEWNNKVRQRPQKKIYMRVRGKKSTMIISTRKVYFGLHVYLSQFSVSTVQIMQIIKPQIYLSRSVHDNIFQWNTKYL